MLVVVFQTALTYVYPAFTFLFKRLSEFSQVACACLPPVMKLSTKNLMNSLFHEIEDSKPQFINFNVKIFYALFACCLQNATSYNTAIVLVAMDFVHASLSLRKVKAAINEFNVSMLETMNGENATLWRRIDFIKAAIYLIENGNKIYSEQSIRLRSHDTRQKITRILLSNLATSQPSFAFLLKRSSNFRGGGVVTVNGRTKEKPSGSQSSNQEHLQPPPSSP